MLVTEVLGHVERLVVVDELVLRGERLFTQPSVDGGSRLEVAVPVGLGSPCSAEDGLARRLVVAQDHCEGVVPLPALAAGVCELQERAAERPPGIVPVGGEWQSERHQRQAAGLATQPEQWPLAGSATRDDMGHTHLQDRRGETGRHD